MEILDLAVNEITNLNFLPELKAKKLKNLYLDNNHLKDIYPLLNTNFPNLSIISLNDNNFNIDNMENSPEYIELKNRINKNGENLEIQLGDIFGESSISRNQQIPGDEFLCPECHKLEPEILNINVDNKTIEFQCKICGGNEYKFEYFYKKIDSDDIICYYFELNADNQGNKFWLKEYKKQNHSSKDNKNSLMEQISERDLKENKEIIKQKNEQLKKIIKFNEVIIKTIEYHQNNYVHLKNLKNICNSFERENLRDSTDLKFVFTYFNNEIEISNKAIDKFLDTKNVKIEREEENLFLSNKQINDENIKCLSIIKFNQLKDIDLSYNDITNIEPLSKANLPFLEKLNLSFNKINNIKPLSEINLRKLKYLFIHNNQIEDIQVFIDFNSNFRELDILILDDNNIKEDSDSFKKLLAMYNQIIITNKKIDEMKNHYNIENNEDMEEIKVEGTEEGDSMLKNIFIIISYKKNSRIKKLKLAGNKIENPLILNRIQLNSLEELDLSSNNIKNLNFLKGIKANNLFNLFLDHNNINDLSLLYNINELFPCLKCISLKNNNFSFKESEFRTLIDYLKFKNIKLYI